MKYTYELTNHRNSGHYGHAMLFTNSRDALKELRRCGGTLTRTGQDGISDELIPGAEEWREVVSASEEENDPPAQPEIPTMFQTCLNTDLQSIPPINTAEFTAMKNMFRKSEAERGIILEKDTPAQPEAPSTNHNCFDTVYESLHSIPMFDASEATEMEGFTLETYWSK